MLAEELRTGTVLREHDAERRWPMLLMIGIVILVLWLLGVIALPAIGGLIHLLLLVAVIVIIAHFLGVGRGQQAV